MRFNGGSFGGRAPWRTAPATGAYSSSTPSRALRRSRPPRLISPRPTNSMGNRRRLPKIPSRMSTYFGDAMLPSSTTSQSGPISPSNAAALRSSGRRYPALSWWTSPPANARNALCVTRVSGLRRPAVGVMTCTPQPTIGLSGSGGAAKRAAYVSLPRKYKPLTNMKMSPSIAPRRERSSSASANCALGDITCRARGPPQLAGEIRKIRECGAAMAVGSGHEALHDQVQHNERNERHRHHRADDAYDEDPVASSGRTHLSRMPLEQREVLRVRLPEEVGDVTDERHDARRQVDADVDEHSQLHDPRDPHAVPL